MVLFPHLEVTRDVPAGVQQDLLRLLRYVEQIAKEVATVRSANVVLLGMAAPYIGILSTEELRSAVARVFERKGEAIVEANLKAFDAGVAAVG